MAWTIIQADARQIPLRVGLEKPRKYVEKIVAVFSESVCEYESQQAFDEGKAFTVVHLS